MTLKNKITNFLQSEYSSGVILFFCAILAILVANCGLSSFYFNFLSTSLPLNIVGFHKEMNLQLWINDGLMAIFFLLVGLELKREMIAGELSSKAKVILPLFAAIGGVLAPALIYSAINFDDKINLQGWAIPAATDIAFAIGVLNLFGKKVPNSLKLFLVALAVLDDLAAILIIAFFYNENIAELYLGWSVAVIFILMILNKLEISTLTPYLILGAILWLLILKSGIHPTLAGVILAFTIPLGKKNNFLNNSPNKSPLKKLEQSIYSSVSYLILPLFAFANSGIIFSQMPDNIWASRLFLSIALALFFGKQIGVASMVFLLVKLKICPFFKNSNWLQFYGVALLTGIGFTMSLFIANLSFNDHPELFNEVRAGIIAGSLLSGICGYFIIYLSLKIKK